MPQGDFRAEQNRMAVVALGIWDFRWPTWQEVALGFGLFIVLAAVSVVVTGLVVIRLPADYFARRHPPPLFEGRHPALRIIAVLHLLVSVQPAPAGQDRKERSDLR